MMTGIFRYVRHQDVERRAAEGWRVAADHGAYHGQWAVLMWWCCGDCADGEAP